MTVIWLCAIFFVILNSIDIGLFKKILIFLNNFFLKEALKDFIGNSAGSRIAKLSLSFAVVPIVTGVTSFDSKATLEASRILTARGIFADSAEYQATMALTKNELFKASM